MKKLYLFLLLLGISLIPSFTYALSDSNYFEIVDYGILGGSNRSGQTLYQIYSTSNDYIKSLIEDNSSTPYHTFYLKHISTTSSYIHYQFYMYFSDSELTLSSCVRSTNSNYFFEITYRGIYSSSQTWEFGVKPDKLYTFDFYLNLQNNKYYNNSTFTDSNLFTSFEDLNPTITTSFGRIQGTSYTNESYLTDRVINHSGSSTGTSYLELYSNNNSLSYCYLSFYPSGTDYNKSRGIRYVDSGGELIAEYDVGDVVDGYYELYFSKPQYLNNYKKVTLESGIEYFGISGVSSGYVYIPIGIYEQYYPFLFYYDTDLDIQPYENNIYESEKMPDGFYYRIPFNLSNSPNSELVMISKDLYGYDEYLSYDIYVPNDSYIGEVTVVSYNGGNTFDFDYKDSNNDIVNKNFFTYDESLMKGNDLFSGLFEKFGKNFYGLSDIVAMPLNLVLSLTSSTCSNLVLPLPFVNSSITLPCMSSIYSSYFGGFYILYQVLVSGFISYWILLDMFRIIKNLKDPSNDKVEVLRL